MIFRISDDMLNIDQLNLKVSEKKFLALFKGMCSACSYERSEVEFIYSPKTTQENLYQKLLKLIRENPLKFC